MFKARERNTGWRIDYFLVSARLVPSVKDAFIRPDVMGSDHCPVGLLLETQRRLMNPNTYFTYRIRKRLASALFSD